MTTFDSPSVRGIIERAAGAARISDDVEGYSIDGLSPGIVAMPRTVQELSQITAAASEANLAITPWGGGTRLELGNKTERLDVVVALSDLHRLVQHTPADLTATVEAGITLGEFQEKLAQQGQFLPFDPPLPDRATVGGSLAAGTSGPLKWQFGNPRDFVIGMKVVQADGKVTKSGGQVVKNVSGYDMSRLHIGGLGTLGIIVEVSFKLAPLPQNQLTAVATFNSSRQCLEAGLSIFHSHLVPLALTNFDGNVNKRTHAVDLDGDHFVSVRLGGRPRTLARQVDECTALLGDAGATRVEVLDETAHREAWRRLADFGWHGATTPFMLGRASLPPTKVMEVQDKLESPNGASGFQTAIISHPGYGALTINWFADEDGISSSQASGILRRTLDIVHAAGGRMIIERCPLDLKSQFDVWDEVGESLAIMRRMKEQFDPKRILNPGRFTGSI